MYESSLTGGIPAAPGPNGLTGRDRGRRAGAKAVCVRLVNRVPATNGLSKHGTCQNLITNEYSTVLPCTSKAVKTTVKIAGSGFQPFDDPRYIFDLRRSDCAICGDV